MIQVGIPVINNIFSIFDAGSLIRYGGLLVVCLVVFGTTGLFFCFFLPSSAVLFAAGVFTATGDLHYDIFTVCGLVTLAWEISPVIGLAGKRDHYCTNERIQDSSGSNILKQPMRFM